MENKEDYEIKYEEFWKNIVENEDGTINKDQLMRELFDYSMVIDNCERAYCDMTNGIISKCNTKYDEVESIFNKLYTSKDNYDVIGCSEDVIDLMNDSETKEELERRLLEYFELEDYGYEQQRF